MVNNINISASYNDQNHIFICQPGEFLKNAAEWFKLDARNVVLYAVNKRERYKISPLDILDFMKIEIVDKDPKANGQRQLRSYFTVEPRSLQSFVKDVIEKLKNNTPLSGNERKQLVEWLESNPDSILGKRKHSERSSDKETAHKKIQVSIQALKHSKDSFSQTDAVNIHELNGRETENQEEHISTKIKKLAYVGNAEKKEIQKLMNESFDDRRHFILSKSPLVAAIRDKYPLLFSFDEVKNELDRLFYPGICKQFIINMVKYSKHILESCDSNDDINLRTYIDHVHTETQKTYARVVGSVFALSKVLEEDFRFIHLTDNPHSSLDIYPHIDASCYSLKEIFYDNIIYNIIVEERRLCEAPNFQEAVLCLMAAFFIFNIDYPDNCRRTLTVFEKLFLCANDTTDMDEMTAQMIKLLQLKAKD